MNAGPVKPTDDPPGAPAHGISVFLPAFLSLCNPLLSSSAPPSFCFLKYSHPSSPLISHLVFLPCFHTLLPQPSLLDQSSVRLGRTFTSGLLCGLKAFPCPLCASFTISRFLSPARVPWHLDGVPGWQRTVKRTEHGTVGSSSALCQWLPPQPQAVQDPCKQERTDCCRLATGLAPRKLKKALDAKQGWERRSRRKPAAPGEGLYWIWGISGGRDWEN